MFLLLFIIFLGLETSGSVSANLIPWLTFIRACSGIGEQIRSFTQTLLFGLFCSSCIFCCYFIFSSFLTFLFSNRYLLLSVFLALTALVRCHFRLIFHLWLDFASFFSLNHSLCMMFQLFLYHSAVEELVAQSRKFFHQLMLTSLFFRSQVSFW